MYAIEFETDIKDKYIEFKDYDKLMNKHVKVIVLAEDVQEDNTKKNLERLEVFFNDRKNMPKIDSKIDIDKLCNEINNDNFF